MKDSLIYRTDATLIATVLFVLMLGLIYAGAKLSGNRKKLFSNEGADSTIISAVLTLFGFLLAFSFSMSGSRFEERRKLVVEEANCIGTAVLRVDMYPDSDRMELKKEFKNYLRSRIDYYNAGNDNSKITASLDKSDQYSKLLWDRVTQLSKDKEYFLESAQMIPALNSMFDIATTRNTSDKETVPDSIAVLLFLMALISSFYVGYASKGLPQFDWLVVIGFCLLTSLIIFITLDLDRPKRGIINLDASQKSMIELNKMFDL